VLGVLALLISTMNTTHDRSGYVVLIYLKHGISKKKGFLNE
jgi:hypothetical protein